ncbi:MAG: precorrin-2 C(20)-methyltransferase [Firmicutes bacterium]|nr:precorrin-2 C(20)-methyltransferase [Bacillota bacterium]
MKGTLYGIGVGPGDPELLTIKAIKRIQQVDIIAAPGQDVRESVAFQIAAQAVPEIAAKELLPVRMPMVMDRAYMEEAHRQGAALLIRELEKGKDVAFLTLGDPTVYSTFSYLEKIVRQAGYETCYLSGIPSFIAAASTLGVPLAEWQEPLTIIPAAHRLTEGLTQDGNLVFMKSGSRLSTVKELLRESGKQVFMVENCGMTTEKRYTDLDRIPDEAGYFTLIIAKDPVER